MTKVAEIIRFYSLDEIMDFIEKGGEYPLHHLWCYDKIKESDISVECIEYDRNSLINKIGKKLLINNLQQQLNLLKKSKEYDLIFVPFISDVFFLAILKLLHCYKKPILGLGLDTYIPFKKNLIKRFRQKMQRYVLTNGIDQILFFNEKIYHKSNEYGILGKKVSFTDTWGVDLDIFRSYSERQTELPTMDYIYTTGISGRDYKTLIEAFKEIDFKLKITSKGDDDVNLQNNKLPNVFIDHSIKPGLYSVGLIRKDYYNSLAVAIPLVKSSQLETIGITVIMEAFAMGKPVISTINPMYPFDLQKEKVGLYVDYNDVEGWRQSVNYLINNPDEAREMGERGRFLCEKKYNYKLFSMEVIKRINKYQFVNTK
jgi:glycosyltransferase involved in cell wall biosynthesis